MSTFFVSVTQIHHQLNFTVIIPDDGFGFVTMEKTIYLDDYDQTTPIKSSMHHGDDGYMETTFDYTKFISEKLNLETLKKNSELYKSGVLLESQPLSVFNDFYDIY